MTGSRSPHPARSREARSIGDAVVAQESSLAGLQDGIYVSVFGNGMHLGLPLAEAATDAEIQNALADLKARLKPAPAATLQPLAAAPVIPSWKMMGGMNPYAQCPTSGG